jgi:hypothetical protein
MNENLKRLLREDIECWESSMSTTPHLSRIHHAEVALLKLLEEPNRRPAITLPLTDEPPPPHGET